MTKRSRGRPQDSSPHKGIDEPLLEKTALLLRAGRVRTPTEGFRKLVGSDSDARIRRLQRRWSVEGTRLLEEIPASWRKERWAIEADALKQAAPDFLAQLESFCQSEGGREVLLKLEFDADSSHPMSLGVMKFAELLQTYQPVSAAAAERSFAEVMALWCRFGIKPNPAFLDRFAELCRDSASHSRSGHKQSRLD